MKFNRTTKSALFTSVVSLFLCFAMLLGTTFAWFTDSATSANNKIVAGTLDVQLWMYNGTEYVNIGDDATPIFGAADSLAAKNDAKDTLWEPGKTQVVYLKIVNNGSLDLKYNVAINVRDNADDKNLYEVLEYAIDAGVDSTMQAPVWDGGKKVIVGNNVDTTDVKLPAKEDGSNAHEHYFTLSVHMLEEAGNEYQGGYVEFDIKVLATQVASEKDSFNNQYDVDATYPDVDFGTKGDILSADDVDVTVPDTAPAGDYALDVSNKNVVTENNETTVSYDITLTKDGVKVTDDGTEYIVSIDVGKDLNIAKVMHNGAEITNFNYDRDTGIVTFTTTHFSPFAVTYYDGAIKVELPENATPEQVEEANKEAVEKLESLIVKGGEFDIAFDMTIAETLVIPEGVELVLDLNGKNITSAMTSGRTIVVKGVLNLKNGSIVTNDGVCGVYASGKSASLTLTDMTIDVNGTGSNAEWNHTAIGAGNGATVVINNGTYSAEVGYGLTVMTTGAHITINDGTFTTEGVTNSAAVRFDSGWDNSKIYTSAAINGGTFNAPEGGYAFKATNAYGKDIVIYDGIFNGKLASHYQENGVVINGGTFNKAIVEGGGHTDRYLINGGTFVENVTKYLATGYTAVKNADGTYTVIFPQESFDSLIDNAQAGDTVEVPAGEYTFPASDLKEGMILNCAPGTVFEGKSAMNINGATVIGATFSNPDDVAGAGTINGTFKDCVFEGSEVLRWCYAGETVVFENCEFKTDFRGVHFDGMDHDVIFRNCKINGFNAFGGTATVTFEGCTFGYDESRYNGLNMYCNTVLKDCKFEYVSGKTNFIDFEEAGHNLTITNCTATLDGKAANVLDFVGGTYKNQTNITIDGAQYVTSTEGLKAAIEAGKKTIYLSAGDYSLRFTNNTAFNANGVTFKGADGVKLSISSTEAWYGRVQGSNVTFENIHFTSSVGTTGAATYNNCVFDNWTVCASSNNEKTYFNNCTINGCLNTSTDFSSGDTFVKDSTVAKAEFSGNASMNFENCTIGELISWDMATTLTNCTVETLDDSHMSANEIVVK